MITTEEVKNILSSEGGIEKVETLITALEIFAYGDPISVGLDEVKEVSENALNYFQS
jgi:hypothetical protein